ncbi:hypothetical protein M408DRAFT_232438 [Serendipita vermifera MAFF 305830]|uniref:Uncharacterized protein n=1 Tax=Serendipita vermifera MAFF 305830 TaxID=933852 RepID=A0A0C3AIR2_SERVB|nr:hypothetical protein M408DRAFT_232438 [Serendipita vermifera MAFF 305830]
MGHPKSFNPLDQHSDGHSKRSHGFFRRLFCLGPKVPKVVLPPASAPREFDWNTEITRAVADLPTAPGPPPTPPVVKNRVLSWRIGTYSSGVQNNVQRVMNQRGVQSNAQRADQHNDRDDDSVSISISIGSGGSRSAGSGASYGS